MLLNSDVPHPVPEKAPVNIMQTSTCRQWPKSCWMFVKSTAVMQAIGMDHHQFLWFSLTLLLISGLFALFMYKRKVLVSVSQGRNQLSNPTFLAENEGADVARASA